MSTPTPAHKRAKNPHAVALGRKGGNARLEKMTPEARRAVASAGGKALAESRRKKKEASQK